MAWIASNIVHGRIGRMWMAVRDMDIAAELIGIRLLRAKLLAFAVSSFYVGVAGALMVFLWLGAAEAEAFNIDLSFQILFMIIIGGCYDAVKPKIPVIVNPWSTGITLSLIPKASVDKIPILSMAYGLSASAKGDVFPWVFNPPATYWDGLSEILKYVGGGSIDALKGKTIGYLYFDAGFGKEPIPLFQALAKDIGFNLKLYPVAPADMQNQSSKWLDAAATTLTSW